MISNYILRDRIKTLKQKLHDLGRKRLEVQGTLNSFRLTDNQKRKLYNVDEFVKAERGKAIVQMKELEGQSMPIKKELQDLYREEDSERNKQLMIIFKEIFSSEQLKEINTEAKNRMIGEENKVLTFSFRRHDEYKNDFYKYRQLAKDQIERMIEFRIMLTGLIENGCEQFGQPEFLKFISPLNQLIIPLKELEKIKRNHLL